MIFKFRPNPTELSHGDIRQLTQDQIAFDLSWKLREGDYSDHPISIEELEKFEDTEMGEIDIPENTFIEKMDMDIARKYNLALERYNEQFKITELELGRAKWELDNARNEYEKHKKAIGINE